MKIMQIKFILYPTKPVFYICIFFPIFIINNNIMMQKIPCRKSRQIFNTTWGIISDGPFGTDYNQDFHCEWLIRAIKKEYYITLTFISMGRECSYDFIFIYDGDTFESPLLGSFNGRTEHQEITAKSGSMLILLFSDGNYVLNGFKAEFSVTMCPKNCTGHGTCLKNQCHCESNWSGNDCSFEICPQNCGSDLGRGLCTNKKCHCFNGYSGVACDLYMNDSIGNRWHWLSNDEAVFSARAAHSAVYIKEKDSFYIFGGHNLNHILGDLLVYSFNKSSWENSVKFSKFSSFNITRENSNKINEYLLLNIWSHTLKNIPENISSKVFNSSSEQFLKSQETIHDNIKFRNKEKKVIIEQPSPRYGHAASKYPGGFVIYGGKASNGSLSNELWFYNVTENKWSLRAKFSVLNPPKLTRHTLTLGSNDILYLFGGSTIGDDFSSKMYSIKLNTDEKMEQWQYIQPHGGNDFDVKLIAHTTTYYQKTDSLIIYGGILSGFKLSDRMFLFKIPNRYWSEIHYSRSYHSDSFIPKERAFHSSVILGNYLVVFGGYSQHHNKDEICYDNQLYLYHLECHTWVSHDVFGLTLQSTKYWKKQGTFAHAADTRNGNTLLIVGGYRGNVNADLWAYVMPPTLASREGEAFESEQVCTRHRTLKECTSNPECGWCSADEICYGRTIGVNCTTNLQTTRCPGLCPILGDCHSCLIQGQTLSLSHTSSVPQKLKLGQCIWCVQNGRCHHRDDNYGVCGLREDTSVQIPSWWGLNGTEIVSVDECRTSDRRPGLIFMKYKHPANLDYPDSVTILNATTVEFDLFSKHLSSEITNLEETIKIRLLGFLWIPKEWENNTGTLRMCASFSSTILRLSPNYMSSKLELVANLSGDSNNCKTTYWISGAPVVLHPGRFLLDLEASKPKKLEYSSYQHSEVMLLFNKSQESSKAFTFEFLEPYQNGSCGEYKNCLQCLTDSLCGWCDVIGSCLLRSTNESQFCSLGGNNWRYLILQPSACINCSNYISCESCVSNTLCEWWIEEEKCLRKGRSPSGVQSLSRCPIPCHLRKNCSQCLDEKGPCVWCDATKECFSFSLYTSEYQFGLCRERVDQNFILFLQAEQFQKKSNFTFTNERCKDCSKHRNCTTCLQTLSCGWCYEIENPVVGVCVQGDFNKPERDDCSSAISKVHNKSLKGNESAWSYAQCPDVNECDLKLDDCHSDAICTNTYGSFDCKCKRGFHGDGRHNCSKTCYYDCIHGTCSFVPDYLCQCDLGWTGEDCGIDCGCHNHSTCHNKVGFCDNCQDWTSGEFCQYCLVGSYGNATSAENCRKCECNGHEDFSRGICDAKTGICFCKDNTEGEKCEKCKKGFYGNPVNGGLCYYQCDTRGVLTGFQPQAIGSHRLSLVPWEAQLESKSARDCLWIIYLADKINSSQTSVIQLTIEGDLTTVCQDNAIYVYEGLPDFVSSGYQNHALGTFCERDDQNHVTIETRLGALTILYKQGNESQGFNASYNILTCPDHCPGNRHCIQNECICKNGWTGYNCTLPICYNNCYFHIKQGVCDKDYGRCICKSGYGGLDCSVKVNNHEIIFTELFSSEKISVFFDHLRKMIPRFGHSVVTDHRGSLWMFGGYSHSYGPLNDIRLFDTKNNTWMQVTVDFTVDASMPRGRYFHASEIVHSRREIYIFGGIGAKGTCISSRWNSTLSDFWKFSIKHQRWVDIKMISAPPPIAGHTLTLVKESESDNLLSVGGFSPNNGFVTDLWEFSLESHQWRILKTLGIGPIGIYGHSAVYHPYTKSLYIYGGYQFFGEKIVYSNQLFSFHYPTLSWSPLPTFEEYNPAVSNLPQPRFLHSAITTKDYMLIFGGKMFQKKSAVSFSDLLIAYSYSCNQWIRLIYKGAPIIGSLPPLTFAQAMTYDAESRAIYIVGGFDNSIHSEVTRVTLPLDLCNLWQGKEKCRSFLGCSFCSVLKPDKSSTNYCYSSAKSLRESCYYYNGTLITNNGVLCDSKWFQHRNCEHFKTCSECLAKWPTYIGEETVCKWCRNCSKERCVSLDHTCGQEVNCNIVTNLEQCNLVKVGIDEPGTNRNFNYLNNCSDFNDCFMCLSRKCIWSTAMNKCFSPYFQPLFCAGGICGLVVKEENFDQCPKSCSSHSQCATCLKNSQCGWCSLTLNKYTGQGICTEGTLEKPLLNSGRKSCQALVSHIHDFVKQNGSTTWNYLSCPEENECINGHHTCNSESEICEDLPQGFRCVCGPGYKLLYSKCEPVCSQGCVHGKCIRPNHCLCDFGFVGKNCSMRCKCNGHSNCAGPDKLSECLECHNNTRGAQCDRCKPLFVGDPSNNGKCIPCIEYCHQHTNICVNQSSEQLLVNKTISELILLLEEGPTTDALCIGCTNNTSGRKCDKCLEGFFRGTEDLRHHCKPCECNGHADRCDPVTGEKCNCGNNTESECQISISENSNQQCWMSQCSKCKETYSGTPTKGHQCYKQMTLDHKFCLNSKLIEECKLKPKPLYPGQSAFFQVQPRYVNVDIRVFIDVMQGGLDLYLSLNDDSLVVTTNSSSGQHSLEWDMKYMVLHAWVEGNSKSSINFEHQAEDENWSFIGFGLVKEANGLTTYITISKKKIFLHVKNIKGRLVLTLPKDKFDLINTRFYIGLVASSTGETVMPTYGILFFRQDQLHIDLFVFFSVFFSCFFLFLAGCVLAWMAKQAADIRRARRRHVVEMLHMAKRPFAKVTLYLDGEVEESSSSPYHQSVQRCKNSKNNEPHPVAVEPTSDGVAAIATFFVKLPGGQEAPVQLALASSLVLISKIYHFNSRVFLRRRSSHRGST